MKYCSHHLVVAGLLGFILGSPFSSTAQQVDFEKDIKIILESTCLSCHSETKPKADLMITTRAGLLKGSENGVVVVPGKPEESPFYTSTVLPHDDDDFMPPKGDPLTPHQTGLLKRWIEQGAPWPDTITLQQVPRVNFVKDIQPILETKCVSCHMEGHEKGDLALESWENIVKSNEKGPFLVVGNAGDSSFYTSTVLPADHDDLMPPVNKGGPLPTEQTDLIRNWINQGAYWPEGLVLKPVKEEAVSVGDNAALVERIHFKIVTNLAMTITQAMEPYTNTIPASQVSYAMVPIPGGEFVMGSPDSEPNRKPDEGPQVKVTIEPFWMGKLEITWNEFEMFMYPQEEKKIRDFLGYQPEPNSPADAVTRPTAPYVEMSFGMGKDGYPAISMTQHAANKYCQWLSAKTGHYYRLPTEAEWEYACRAGTTTAFSFGDDAAQIGDYAWFAENSNWQYQKVGTKKPNPWGLHDMHGNVVEWCLDQYAPDFYKSMQGQVVAGPWNKATNAYPHVVRGGSWDDDPELLRSAARRFSARDWKMQDPQLPKSIWYHTDAQFLGFRIIRPLRVPPPEVLNLYWNSGVEKEY